MATLNEVRVLENSRPLYVKAKCTCWNGVGTVEQQGAAQRQPGTGQASCCSPLDAPHIPDATLTHEAQRFTTGWLRAAH